MNEISKTLTFVSVAAAVVLLAVFTRPVLHTVNPDDLRGQPLYPDFKDPLAVTSLEIVEFDDETATVHPFLVKQVEVKGVTRWVIPSHDNYPADAKDQVASAAAGMMGLKILEVAGDQRRDQREYGVIDPDPKALRVGATGVGERIVMQDKDGKELLALVIGKEVPDRPGLRYVRKVGENPVCVVEINTSKLSTKFDDWIERNLLGITTWDMRRLWFRDYSVDELNAALIQRGDMRIAYDDDGQQHWKLIEDRKYEAGKWTTVKLAEDDELNAAKLGEMKTALDDLKIVDVRLKPAGLSADLKAAADFADQQEAVQSLARKGFFVAKLDKRVELFSNEGEVRVTMKDGVEYVLRFGEIAVGSAVKKDKPKEGEEAKQPDNGVNRYLFVMAEFNPDIIPKPQFEPLPEIKQEGDAKQPEDKKAEEKKPDEQKPEAEKADEDQPPKPVEKTEAELKAERERIERDNQRKQDEYDRLVSDGKKRMADLNARFADWYYIISNDVFQKIHLTRDELIKKKEKPAEGEQGKAGPLGAPSDVAFPAEVLDKLKAQRPAGEK